MPIRGVVGGARAAHPSGKRALSVLAIAGAVSVSAGASVSAPRPSAPAAAHRTEIVEAAAHPSGDGLYLLDGSGGVRAHGSAPYLGSLPERGVTADAVEVVPTASGLGYWIFDATGGVHTFGDAPFFGAPAKLPGRGGAAIVAATATPEGEGYVVLDAEGGVFAFGRARFAGSVPALRAAGLTVGSAPAIDLAAAPGGGYYVLDAVGGIFSFGGPSFFGSIPTLRAEGAHIGTAPVRDLVVAGNGRGYWVTDAAGGIFGFGAVAFHGSAPSIGQPFSLAATAVIPDGSGYWMVDAAGDLLAFGAAADSAEPSAGAPSPTPGGSGAFAFSDLAADGAPVRFNPCRPIPYAVHVDAGAPDNALRLTADAFARLSEATGITFVDRGTTGETFSTQLDRPRWNHPSYGSGPTPVLVSFEPPSGRNGLMSDDAGLAGRQSATNTGGRPVVVTAAAVINTALGLSPDFSGSASYGGALLHELGHVMGLDHVNDGRQIMTAVLRPDGPGTYQDGDRRGLAELGTGGGCLSDPAPR